jgi:hypothetical protein
MEKKDIPASDIAKQWQEKSDETSDQIASSLVVSLNPGSPVERKDRPGSERLALEAAEPLMRDAKSKFFTKEIPAQGQGASFFSTKQGQILIKIDPQRTPPQGPPH